MAYEKKPGDISVFLNSKKTPENNLPNYTGQALIGDVLYNVSLWLKYPDGKPAYLSGKIEKHTPRESTVTAADPIQQPPKYEAGPLEDDSPAPEDRPKRTKKQIEEESSDLPF